MVESFNQPITLRMVWRCSCFVNYELHAVAQTQTAGLGLYEAVQ